MEQKSEVNNQQSEEKNSDQVKLPASRKTYVETNGSAINENKHSLRVPFREIALSPSKDFDGTLQENAPVRVYDTSGAAISAALWGRLSSTMSSRAAGRRLSPNRGLCASRLPASRR